jgi:signal transduction histidine kinase
MSAAGFPDLTLAQPAKLRFRPPSAALILYLAILLGVELLAEALLINEAPPARALARWSLLVLAAAPALGLIAWRSCQADEHLAVGAARDRVRQLALALTAERDKERVPEMITRQAFELSGARLAFLARPDGEAFRVDTVVGNGAQHLVGQRLAIGPDSPGLAGQALRSGKPAALADTWCDAGLLARRELALPDRARSAAALPLVVRGEVIGLIGLHAETVRKFDERRLELLGLYAEQASGPLENALLSTNVTRLSAVQQLDQLKSEFLSAVAHELRAPLGPLVGWCELLLTRDYTPEQARPMIEKIHEGGQHLSVLVGDLLDLSSGEAGRLALDPEQLDFGELLETTIQRWREQDQRHEFVLMSAGDLPLQADRHRVRQVLDNLLSNAAKYSPEGSRVLVTARSESDGSLTVRVSDQGMGLTHEESENLFTKFYRTDSARRQALGTGLGLALCRLIVEAHGGRIEVESDGPGCGTAFTFRLPARNADSKPAHVFASSA